MPRKKKAAAAAPESVAAAEHANGESKPRRKNIDLPGMLGDGVAKPEIPELDDAVLSNVKHRDKRQEEGMKEQSEKKLVLALMEKHKLGSYEVDDMVVVRRPKDATASIKVMAKADYTGDPADADPAGE
jgi:hypothetical protein